MSSISSSLPSGNSANQTSSSGVTPAADPLANESTFLTLLVSQLQNQDPLSPVDSNQFVSQLTEYSQLEQLIGIHSDTTALKQSSAQASAANTNAAGNTTGNAIQSNSTAGVN